MTALYKITIGAGASFLFVITPLKIMYNIDINDTKVVDIENQLRFDIAKDVYLTKKKLAEDLREKADKKAFEQKILGLIAEKQEGSLREKSIEELQKMIEK